jgi:integral membrane protein (TIGR00529 family)
VQFPLNPLWAFTLSYAALVAAVASGVGALEAIAVLIVSYTALTWAWAGAARSLVEVATTWGDLRVFVFIFLSMLLAGLLREGGILDLMVESAGRVGCRFSLAAVPAMIGLMPMPGGALVSAIAMRRRYLEEAGVSREWATYLNYWFRHVWVPSWPLFQSMVITASVFAAAVGEPLDPALIAEHTWPATIAAIAAGALVSAPLMARLSCPAGGRGGLRGLLVSLSPFILVAVLSFGLKLSLLASLAVTVALVAAALRPSRRQLAAALRLAGRPRIHAVLLEALMFKNLLISTGAPHALMGALHSWGLPLWAVAYLLPFTLGLSAGGENFFAATAMPLLASTIAGPGGIDWRLLMIAYTGGYLGVMASPVHLCLVLSAEYYQSSIGKPLALTLLTIAATTGLLAAWAALTA